MKTPEGKPKDEIRKWLESIGAYVFSPVQMGYGRRTLDLLVCIGGKFIAIEVKAKGKKPTEKQFKTIKQINTAGGYAFWCDSLEGAKAVLKMWNLT